jgi:hypothetical protein
MCEPLIADFLVFAVTGGGLAKFPSLDRYRGGNEKFALVTVASCGFEVEPDSLDEGIEVIDDSLVEAVEL